ncbi:MAG TPA: DUF4139 domain-containing protein [Kiritimatiellia bacterium]|jgi:hypothetical protein|nr:DUF4139 domain-containing protein [Kiritimatiellia bacterium]OQC58797.1 MAG: hypothetical protein BWX54_00929 [Verrucomicrobia bacterium ADurb.Bin018]MBP9571841.1 DUF4139 domain-containing protein [Kiritimatiellia bacterium]HOD99447.1 DUF4139 domain-containing protein [Kiritimatiellia bacterium]HOE36066.1 DUF4139 domain-containing protein [Kiritimatiellia bacterium]
MKKLIALLLFPAAAWATGPQVTIYNDGFATVKETRNLQLTEGVSTVRVTDMSRQLEPDSVMLRELGKKPFGVRILEQSFVNDPLTEGLMLYQMEGQNVRFEEKRRDGTIKEHLGKVIRSGYIPGGGSEQPIIETDGAVRFSLPGQPVFEGLDPTAFLKPSLVWELAAERAGECPVEVAYVTAGMSWEATYNLVMPAEGGDTFDFSGWISLRNSTGKDFADTTVKLIAGDVQKVTRRPEYRQPLVLMGARPAPAAMPEERAFDEFHLYTLPRPVQVRNNELKQVEFLRASGVKGTRYYVYNPLVGYGYSRSANTDADYGQTASKKVGVRIEIENREDNQLGVPLPKGRMRLYRTDVDGRREFTGENQLDHLPKNEKLKLEMGSAFDLVGERKQTDFSVDTTAKRMSETIEIKLRNRKEKDAVEIRVIEPLYRSANWKISAASAEWTRFDSHTIEFRVPVPADGETVLTYTVNYSW